MAAVPKLKIIACRHPPGSLIVTLTMRPHLVASSARCLTTRYSPFQSLSRSIRWPCRASSLTRAFTTTTPCYRYVARGPSWARWQQAQESTAKHQPIDIDQFLDLAQQGAASAEQAKACLWQERTRLEALPSSSRARTVRDGKKLCGSHVLHWIMSQPKQRREELSQDRLLTELVCWFLVPEQNEDYIWRWLQIATTDKLEVARAGAGIHRWGSHWLGALAAVQYQWTGSPAESLRCYAKAVKLFERYVPIGQQGVLVHILVTLQTVVEDRVCEPYDGEDYDMWLKQYPRFHPQIVSLQKVPEFQIWHPTKPEAFPYFEIALHGHLDPIYNHAMLMKQNATSSRCMRAAYILRLQGFIREAEWLHDFVRDKSPNVWNARRKLIKECDQDPKLEHLRRAAASR